MWNTKNIIERAINTLWQTFIGTFAASIAVTPLSNFQSFKAALIGSAVASLLSVSKNLTAEGVKVQAVKESNSVQGPPAAL